MKRLGKIAEDVRLLLEGREHALEPAQRIQDGGAGLGDAAADLGVRFLGQRGSDAAGDGPGRVDLLPAQVGDDLLAELAEADAGAGQFRLGGNQPKMLRTAGSLSKPRMEIGRAEVEEAQRMRLDDLPRFINRRNLSAAGGMLDRQDLVRRLGGRQEVADRADPADARRDARHLVQRAPSQKRSKPRNSVT